MTPVTNFRPIPLLSYGSTCYDVAQGVAMASETLLQILYGAIGGLIIVIIVNVLWEWFRK